MHKWARAVGGESTQSLHCEEAAHCHIPSHFLLHAAHNIGATVAFKTAAGTPETAGGVRAPRCTRTSHHLHNAVFQHFVSSATGLEAPPVVEKASAARTLIHPAPPHVKSNAERGYRRGDQGKDRRRHERDEKEGEKNTSSALAGERPRQKSDPTPSSVVYSRECSSTVTVLVSDADGSLFLCTYNLNNINSILYSGSNNTLTRQHRRA